MVCSANYFEENSLDTSKAKFDSFVSTLRWICINGLRLFLQFWYAKQPMFWLPHGWIPYYAEWLLSFPRAPLGSISIQAWQLACTSVILLVSDAIVAVIALVVPAQKEKEKPMKHAGKKPTAESAFTQDSGSKKEM
jgi:tail-anchored protein insertion receptor